MLFALLFLTFGTQEVLAAPKSSTEKKEQKSTKNGEKLKRTSGKKSKKTQSQSSVKKKTSKTVQKKSGKIVTKRSSTTAAHTKGKSSTGSASKNSSQGKKLRQTQKNKGGKTAPSFGRNSQQNRQVNPGKKIEQRSQSTSVKPTKKKGKAPVTRKKSSLYQKNKRDTVFSKYSVLTPKQEHQLKRLRSQMQGTPYLPQINRNRKGVSQGKNSIGHCRKSGKSRRLNRRGMTTIGVQGLGYGSGYTDGQLYLDPGFGFSAGGRLLNAVGVELSYANSSEQFGLDVPDRLNRTVQGVGQLHLMPRQKISPFLTAGVVANAVDFQDNYQIDGASKKVEQETLLWGGVLGAGLEYNVNKYIGLKAEGRYLNYQNTISTESMIEDALQISTGISLYF